MQWGQWCVCGQGGLVVVVQWGQWSVHVQGGQWWSCSAVSGVCVYRAQCCVYAGVSGGVCTVSNEGGCAQGVSAVYWGSWTL